MSDFGRVVNQPIIPPTQIAEPASESKTIVSKSIDPSKKPTKKTVEDIAKDYLGQTPKEVKINFQDGSSANNYKPVVLIRLTFDDGSKINMVGNYNKHSNLNFSIPNKPSTDFKEAMLKNPEKILEEFNFEFVNFKANDQGQVSLPIDNLKWGLRKVLEKNDQPKISRIAEPNKETKNEKSIPNGPYEITNKSGGNYTSVELKSPDSSTMTITQMHSRGHAIRVEIQKPGSPMETYKIDDNSKIKNNASDEYKLLENTLFDLKNGKTEKNNELPRILSNFLAKAQKFSSEPTQSIEPKTDKQNDGSTSLLPSGKMTITGSKAGSDMFDASSINFNVDGKICKIEWKANRNENFTLEIDGKTYKYRAASSETRDIARKLTTAEKDPELLRSLLERLVKLTPITDS